MGREAHRVFGWQQHLAKRGLSHMPVQPEQGAAGPCDTVCAVKCASIQASTSGRCQTCYV